MGQRIFLVDVEATNKTPYSGVMTEFGVVDCNTRCWFHGHLWDFHPDPKVPARPVAERENPRFTATVPSNGGITLRVTNPASHSRRTVSASLHSSSGPGSGSWESGLSNARPYVRGPT